MTGQPMLRPVVAAPTEIATAVVAPGFEVITWDGRATPPRDDIVFWVPSYALGWNADDLRATFGTLPSLRVVQLLSAGVEPWASVVPSGVSLCAGTGIHGGSTAELAVALTLSLLRDLPTYAAQQARHEWVRHAPDTIAGRHVLVLGAGDIGARVAATFESLEARVTVAARTRHTPVDRARDLLPGVDVLVVALPLTESTTGLVDRVWLTALPDRAIVVNVSRGPIVDLTALTEEVGRGRLRAALDVTDPEPLPADHPLWELPGVLVTPHVGGGATGWEDRATRLVEDQLQRLREGAPLRHVVSEGY